MSMKNSNNTIGNQTHDLPACSAVPQQTVPLHTLSNDCTGVWMFWNVVLWRQLLLIWWNVFVLLDVNLTSVVAQALRIDSIAIRAIPAPLIPRLSWNLDLYYKLWSCTRTWCKLYIWTPSHSVFRLKHEIHRQRQCISVLLLYYSGMSLEQESTCSCFW